MLDQHGDLAAVELVFYLLVLPAAAYVSFKHGIAKSSGWYFLLILSVVRIVGTIMTLIVETQGTTSLVTIASILSTVGLSPLTLCTLGVLTRLHDEMPRKPINRRIFFLLGVVPIIGLVLSIVGGTNLSSSKPSDVAQGEQYLQISSILYIVVVALLVLVTFFVGANLQQVPATERKLFYAVIFSLPFLLVRCVYSTLVSYNYLNTASPFNPRDGSIYAQAFMATLEEFVIVLAYITAAIATPKAPRAAVANAQKADHAYPQQSYAYTQLNHPMQSYPPQGYPEQSHPPQGYATQPYPQQETGRVAV